MLFAFVGSDKPGSVEKRLGARPEHLEFLKGLGDRLKLAGPFVSEAGEMNGSIVIIEAADLAEAQRLMAEDPYGRIGLFERAELRPWRAAINNFGG